MSEESLRFLADLVKKVATGDRDEGPYILSHTIHSEGDEATVTVSAVPPEHEYALKIAVAQYERAKKNIYGLLKENTELKVAAEARETEMEERGMRLLAARAIAEGKSKVKELEAKVKDLQYRLARHE